MHCREIMNTNLAWVSDHATVRQAAVKMADAGVGFLPICDYEGRPIGVVTDRDLTTRALAQSIEGDEVQVTRIMSAPVFSCLADAPLEAAESLMAVEHKQRLVCTDLDGRLVGVLSVVDLLERAPPDEALRTARAVMWRESPRTGGSPPGTRLPRDDRDPLLPPGAQSRM